MYDYIIIIIIISIIIICIITVYNHIYIRMYMYRPLDYFSGQPSRLLLATVLTGLSCHTIYNIFIRPVSLISLEADVRSLLNGA